MQFTPKQESEIKRFSTLPDGVYPFSIIESREQASKSEKNPGKIMAAVKLAVYHEGREQWVYDYFADWFSEWKLKHICDTCGKSLAYNNGEVDFADGGAVGWQGYVELTTETDPQYGDKNVVVDYVVKQAAAKAEPKPAATAKAKAAQNVDDSDVPF